MRIIICDDDVEFATRLENVIQAHLSEKSITDYEIAVFNSGKKLIDDRKPMDIVFLDVEMEELDGIRAGKEVLENNKHCIVIVITSYSDYLDDAMRINVFRYISKPLDEKRLLRNFDEALIAYLNIQDIIVRFSCNDETICCYVSEIIFVKTDGKKVIVLTENGLFSFYGSIAIFDNQLPTSTFYRSHRSFLVNLAHVTNFTKDEIVLDNKHRAFLARRKYSDFKKRWITYVGLTN